MSKIIRRENRDKMYLQGQRMYICEDCRKSFQTKGIAIRGHKCKNTSKDTNNTNSPLLEFR